MLRENVYVQRYKAVDQPCGPIYWEGRIVVTINFFIYAPGPCPYHQRPSHLLKQQTILDAISDVGLTKTHLSVNVQQKVDNGSVICSFNVRGKWQGEVDVYLAHILRELDVKLSQHMYHKPNGNTWFWKKKPKYTLHDDILAAVDHEAAQEQEADT